MENKNRPGLRERLISALRGAPEKKAEEPPKTAPGGRQRNGPVRMSYQSHGASTTLNSMVGWIVNGGNAEDNIDLLASELRKRSRDLFAGGGLARSAPSVLTVATVGWGIMPKPKIDAELLGLSEAEVEQAERMILREWELWADSRMCDATRSDNFYGMQYLDFLSMLVSGDVLALFENKPNLQTPYETTLRLIEADRLCTPESSGESTSTETAGGGRIIDGVEIDREGAVAAYHIASRNPEAENDGRELVWTRIDAFGSSTGMPNALHTMIMERPEQRRGVPLVSSEIEQLKSMDRYTKAELAANVVSAMLTAFITSEEEDGQSGIEDSISEDEKVTDDEYKIEMAPGAIYSLPPGKHVETVNPLRVNTAMKDFIETYETFIGAGLGVPREVLIKKFDSNYSASRAAIMEFWRTVKVYRSRFNAQFNQPVYEAWLSEAVALGRIEAPGFFDDPLIRKAWCKCKWIGATMGHIDPLKEVNAAAVRIAQNITTQEQEAAEYNGNDWAANVQQRRRELQTLREFRDLAGTAAASPENDTDGEEDE